ncbi:Beta-galactosidase 7 [Cocos nucifera]|uniref:Beta-galactosidase n=1 Tax=Cocos nucifera TaxID=13894 RepID=A0A8K0HXN7_COCNU|nr:Beta-galactosidase 7 [Cocos nucifera]
MALKKVVVVVVLSMFLMVAGGEAAGARGDVTYDGRALIINGTRRILFSGSIHYPRSTPEFNFEGRYNLVRFIKEIQAQGLYVSLRMGPFIESEWKYGGFPFWLHDVPGIVFRSDNEPFKFYMKRFVENIVNMMKFEKLYYPQGGPIIISQIENEYQMVEPAFHEAGPPYVRWAASMAVGLQTGVPWMMCKQDDAPDPVINTCNGLICGETFAGPNSPTKPSLWTENWTQRYPVYGKEPSMRHVEDLAFSVALFIARKNGSFVNYYMARVFQTNSGNCAAFLVNFAQHLNATVHLHNATYELPSKSISILPDCKRVAFNTAKVGAQYGNRSARAVQSFNNAKKWRAFTDGVPNVHNASFTEIELLEQMSTTKDVTDYLWYTFSYNYKSSDGQQALRVESRAHVLHAFVNDEFVGSVHGSSDGPPYMTFEKDISLREGENNISLLSVMVGLPDSGAYLEKRIAGLHRVSIHHNGSGPQNLTNWLWGYQIGLFGEKLEIYTQRGLQKVAWRTVGSSIDKPLTWYKTTFNAPLGTNPVALDLSSMGKGEVWINGESIGRYWVSFTSPNGQPSQTLYHVPQSFLKPFGNLLVLFEEMGGDPLGITVKTISVTRICSNVAESFSPSLFSKRKQPSIQLQCHEGEAISSIKFTSYGNPIGDCENYALGSCHAVSSKAAIEKACVGKRRCSIPISAATFGGDPCPGIAKSLLVVADCV